jgi:hypothetical protein
MSLRRLAVGGVLALIAVVVAEHILAPGLSPLYREVSEYANARYGALMVAGFAAWAASLAATGALASRARGAHRYATVALSALFALASAGLVLTACFHTQTSAGHLPPGVARALGGELHNLGSGVALLALTLAVPVSACALDRPRYRAFALYLLVIVVAIAIALLIVGPQVAGLRERCLLAAACIWQLALIRALTETSIPAASAWDR